MSDAVQSLKDDGGFNDVRLNLLCGTAFCLFCLFVHHFVSHRVCERCFRSYSGLTWQLQMEWDSRIVSSIHAAVVTILSFYALASEKTLWLDKIDGATRLGGITVSISAGYMIADSVSMPIYWRGASLFIFWLHHGIAAMGFYTCATHGILHFFALFRLLSEMSTPFLNMNWFNRLCNVGPESLLSLGNSLCLFAIYLMCRLLSIPVYWFYFIQTARTEAFSRLASQAREVVLAWIAISLLLDVLNILWAKSILLGSLQLAREGFRMRKIRRHGNRL